MDAGVRPRYGRPQAQKGDHQEGIREGPCSVVLLVSLLLAFLKIWSVCWSRQQNVPVVVCFEPLFLWRQLLKVVRPESEREQVIPSPIMSVFPWTTGGNYTRRFCFLFFFIISRIEDSFTPKSNCSLAARYGRIFVDFFTAMIPVIFIMLNKDTLTRTHCIIPVMFTMSNKDMDTDMDNRAQFLRYQHQLVPQCSKFEQGLV